jgi:hypothetical protein
MKRLRRWTLNVLTAISLLLFIATVVLWVRGHFRMDVLGITWKTPLYSVPDALACIAMGGDLTVRYESPQLGSPSSDDPEGFHFHHFSTPAIGSGHVMRNIFLDTPLNSDRPLITGWMHAGFGYVSAADTEYGFKYRACILPLWGLALAFALLPAVRLPGFARTIRGGWRLSGGLCAVCGYDLRASPDRCPECGTIPVKNEIISN